MIKKERKRERERERKLNASKTNTQGKIECANAHPLEELEKSNAGKPACLRRVDGIQNQVREKIDR